MNCIHDADKEIICSDEWVSVKRLHNCQAWVYETEGFYILKSYRTFGVAYIRKETKQCYDVLRYVYGYTSTSALHIAKFIREYGDPQLIKFTYR